MNKTATLATLIGLAVIVAACNGSADETTTTTSEATTTTEAPTTTTTTATTTTTTGATSGESDGGASITIAGFSFNGPATVEVGTTVTVTNEDAISHTWTAEEDLWDSGTLSQGETFEFTFEEPGEYPYFCRIHPGQMRGTIVVEG